MGSGIFSIVIMLEVALVICSGVWRLWSYSEYVTTLYLWYAFMVAFFLIFGICYYPAAWGSFDWSRSYVRRSYELERWVVLPVFSIGCLTLKLVFMGLSPV